MERKLKLKKLKIMLLNALWTNMVQGSYNKNMM